MPKDGKPRGRMSAYAFFVQHSREEHKKKTPNTPVVFADFSRQCSERWKAASDKEKKKFHDLAEKDKKRYDSDMANFKVSNKGKKGGKDTGRKGKRAKDPDAPKRPLSAFFWFCNEERAKVKSRIPDASVGTIAKELGKMWNECTEDQKAKFESLAAKDKIRYEKDMKNYKAGGGGGSAPAKKGKPAKKEASSEEEEDEDEEEEEEEEEEDSDEE